AAQSNASRHARPERIGAFSWGRSGATRTPTGRRRFDSARLHHARPCDTPHSLRAPWTPAARGAQPGPATSQAGPLPIREEAAVAKYTDAQRAEALAALQANGGNLSATSRATGIPIRTIARWRD